MRWSNQVTVMGTIVLAVSESVITLRSGWTRQECNRQEYGL